MMQDGSQTISRWCRNAGVIPVLTIEKLITAVPVAQALVAGGVRIIEITLRTPCALDAIAAVREALPKDAVKVAAGTVRSSADLFNAKKYKADFVVSPGTTLALLDAAFDARIPILPGVSSASEAMQWHEYGISSFKFFPAEAAGGIQSLQAFVAPLDGLTFCPTGGIALHNVPDYLALPNVLCVGASWMVTARHYADQNWQAVTELARRAMAMRG